MHKQGYTVVPDFMPAQLLKHTREECDSWLEDYDAAKIGGGKVRGKYRKGLLAVTRLFDDLFTDPLMLDIAADVFSPHSYFFSGSSIKVVVPGEDARAMHRDDAISPDAKLDPYLMNLLIAIDDFTDARGATRVVPGSHLWDKSVEQDHHYKPVEMNAGSALLLHGKIWHQNGANTTTQERRALSFAYAAARSRSNDTQVIEGLPHKLRQIM